jgi:hypothetical protein
LGVELDWAEDSRLGEELDWEEDFRLGEELDWAEEARLASGTAAAAVGSINGNGRWSGTTPG